MKEIGNERVIVAASMGPSPYLGGLENVVETIINSQLSRKFNFIIFDTYRVPDSNRKWYQKALFVSQLFVSFFFKLRKSKANIVHIHFCSRVDFLKHSICLIVATLLTKKTVFHLHGGGFESYYAESSSLHKWFIRFIFNLPSVIVALSDYWANFIGRITKQKSIQIINNPVDFKKLSTVTFTEKADDVFKILLLGRLGKNKGHYIAIQAISIISQDYPNIKLFFAGTEESVGDLSSLKEFTRNQKVCEFVEFLGPVIGNEKIALLHSIDLMILPSYIENMPISIIEGMAAAKPIIASNIGAIPEILDFGNIGTIIDVGDYKALAKAIIMYIRTPDIKQKHGKAGIKKVEDNWDIRIIANQLEKLYCKLITV